MIKRIVFFLALLFIAFCIYYYINKQGAKDLISDIKGTTLTWTNLVQKPQGTWTQNTWVIIAADGVELPGKNISAVVNDDIKDVISKEIGLENWDGKIEIVKDDDSTKLVINPWKTSTDTVSGGDKIIVGSNWSSTTNNTSTSSPTPTTLSKADLEMLQRLARNVEVQ